MFVVDERDPVGVGAVNQVEIFDVCDVGDLLVEVVDVSGGRSDNLRVFFNSCCDGSKVERHDDVYVG